MKRGRTLGRNWFKSLQSFPPCYSQSPLPTNPPPHPHPLNQRDLKLVCHVNIVYGNLMSENSQYYAQRPHRNVRSLIRLILLMIKFLRRTMGSMIQRPYLLIVPEHFFPVLYLLYPLPLSCKKAFAHSVEYYYLTPSTFP